MICLIADLVVNIPAVGDLVSRCQDYLSNISNDADINIRTELFRENAWKGLKGDNWIYAESGSHFYFSLLYYGGMMLHASAVEVDGKAYLFSANSGIGKSTHTKLWQSEFGTAARVFNDDKPALRFLDGKWYAYGTPWCGKDGININMKVPLAGICFLKQSSENRIRRLSSYEALQKIIPQTKYKFSKVEKLDLMLSHVENLIQHIPMFELENRPEPEAARLSYETMRRAAEEMGL